jgi:plastocyanin
MNKKLFALILVFTIFLVSCGGSAPATTIDVTVTDFQFTPNSFTVPAGKEITLHVLNNGAVVHNFIIMKLGTSAGEAFDEEDEANVFWGERDIPVGGELSVTFTAPTEPGEYQVVCKTQGHIASGMFGTLVVVAAQ